MSHSKRVQKQDLDWINDGLLKIDDIEFIVSFGKELYEEESKRGSFVVGKSRQMVEDYLEIELDHPVGHIVDLGIYKGGSAVLYQKIFDPKTLIALDLEKSPVPALDKYIEQHNLKNTIKIYYGVDQSDSETLSGIIKSDLGTNPIDIVFDDASHRLHETRESFNILFPYLVAGGMYIIEDWAWAHWEGDEWQTDGGLFPEEAPLSNLIFEITMLAASRPRLIESIIIKATHIIVKKGSGTCIPGQFDISKSYFNRGKKATLL